MIGTMLLSLGRPIQKRGVLAYATSVSPSGLLDATNAQRTQNGAGSLQASSALSAAAQAKANDMIARNYWAHVTPDGQQPWVFMDSAGYKYQKAGENLAYGFLTSGETVTGWMNSQTHRDNLLDKAFTEVGFGFANGENYNTAGQETVVVAMYGKPQVLAASNAAPDPTPAAAPQSIPAPAKATPAAQPKPEPVALPAAAPTAENTPAAAKPVTTDSPIIIEPTSKPIARIQTLTRGDAPWALFAIGLLSGLSIMFMFLKHAVGLRHLLKGSERFILHHPLLDTLLVSVVLFSSFMSQTTGFIR